MMRGDWSWYGYTCRNWRKYWHEVLRWQLVRCCALAIAWVLRVPISINLDPTQVRLSEWEYFNKTDTEPMPDAFEVHRRAQAARKRLGIVGSSWYGPGNQRG